MDPEIEGRLAALELIASLDLYGVGRDLYASAWPNHAPEVLAKAVQELRSSLSGAAADAGEAALKRVFDRSTRWV